MAHPEYMHVGDPVDCLVEECAELVQALMKVKRFGWFSAHPETNVFNVDRVLSEMNDVEARIREVKLVIAAELEKYEAFTHNPPGS